MLKTRASKFEHDKYGTSCINYIDSIFYGLNYNENKFYFFDSDGNFIEEMSMNENFIKILINNSINLPDFWPGFLAGLCSHKNNLYMPDYKSIRILKFIR